MKLSTIFLVFGVVLSLNLMGTERKLPAGLCMPTYYLYPTAPVTSPISESIGESEETTQIRKAAPDGITNRLVSTLNPEKRKYAEALASDWNLQELDPYRPILDPALAQLQSDVNTLLAMNYTDRRSGSTLPSPYQFWQPRPQIIISSRASTPQAIVSPIAIESITPPSSPLTLPPSLISPTESYPWWL